MYLELFSTPVNTQSAARLESWNSPSRLHPHPQGAQPCATARTELDTGILRSDNLRASGCWIQNWSVTACTEGRSMRFLQNRSRMLRLLGLFSLIASVASAQEATPPLSIRPIRGGVYWTQGGSGANTGF